MGYFWEGVPPYLLPVAVQVLGLGTTSIETGTFRGDSALLFAETFGSCTTIERSTDLGRAAEIRFENDPRVTVLSGSSRVLLSEALPNRDTSCFFWLDAHGIYDASASDQEENPLLAELQIIIGERQPANTLIAIDDARGMGTQPGWPSIGSICSLLTSEGYDVVFLDDILLAFDSSCGLNTYELYQSGRQTEIPMVFHIWPAIRKLTNARRWLDSAVTKFHT
jgi:hypothetical protein